MKNTSFILKITAAAAILATAFGCVREELDAPEASGKKFTLEVGLAPQVKTYLGEKEGTARKVYWSAKDQIAINGIASEPLADDLPAGTQSATFTVTFPEPQPTQFNVVYPASIVTESDYAHVSLPAVQTYKAGGFAEGMSPMAGYTTSLGASLELKHLCAVLHISIKRSSAANADTDNIVSVSFKGKNNEKVSGSFEITYSSNSSSLTAASTSNDAEKEVRVVKGQETSTDTAVEYYLVVPARTYSNGFEVTIQDVNGDIMKKSKTTSYELVAGKLYNMTEVIFVPTDVETGIEIANAEDLIAFATAYNSMQYDALGTSLVATVTQDISFTSAQSDLFNATGGIGTNSDGNGGTNYFNGVFNGDNHTISGLAATVPVFAFTGGGGIVKNLTLGSTCSYTEITGSNHGALVGRNKGVVKDCNSAASVIIDNIQDVTTANQYYGGLVGYNPGGTIEGCTMSGDITCTQAGQTITANNAYIGGIAGYQQNEGTIKDCTFTGNITVSDGTTYGGITAEGRNFFVAGILGRAEKCNISGCTAGIDGTAKSIDVRGVMVPAIGGIIGWLASASDSEISNCHNYMSLSFASNGARANTTPCRIGGIAARSAALVKNCTNAGAISSVCNSTTLELGGIVGDGVNVSGCTNNAGGTITRTNADQTGTGANRYMYIGGIIGTLNAAGDITDCTNHAAVTCNPVGTSGNTTVDIGGIVGGGNASQMDVSSCVNDGEIKFDNDNENAATLTRKAVGGIVGNVSTAGTTVTGCGNSGKVWCNNNTAGICGNLSIGGAVGHTAASCTVTDCTNSGQILCQNLGGNINAYVDLGGIVGLSEAAITITGTSADATLNSGTVTVDGTGSAIVYARNTQGGILGYGRANDIKITYCKNTAEIKCTLTTQTTNRPSYTGGIVGILGNLGYSSNAANKLSALTGIEIAHCNHAGKVNSSNYCNSGGNKNSAFAGGIAGLVNGAADSKASVHDCTVGNQNVYVYRGTGGGMFGYAQYCTIEDNTCAADLSGVNPNVRGAGGIVGRLFDSTMSNCTFTGKIARAKNIGGLVYTMSEQAVGSTISGCKVNGATLTTGTASDKTAAAVLVSITDDAFPNSITDCGVKGTLDGAAIDLSSNMVTTLSANTTVSGTYLIP